MDFLTLLLVLNMDRISRSDFWAETSDHVRNKLTSKFAFPNFPFGVKAFKPVAFHSRQIIMTHVDRMHFIIV